MRFTLLALLLFVAAHSFAQTDSVETRFATATQSTVITLTRAELQRLPATGFLELVAGAFPFLGTEGIEEDFTYVVNGFVLINPNAINLSQLESISFYPGGTPLTGGTLAKRGTFLISTRPVANRFSVSSKTGLWSATNDELPSFRRSGLHSGVFSLNEFSLQRKSETAFVSGAASFLPDKSPDYLYTSASQTGTGSHWLNRLRASVFGGYRFGRATEVEGGLFYTLQPQRTEGAQKYQPGNYVNNQSANDRANHAGAHAGFRFMPSPTLTNFLTAEITRAKETLDGTSQTAATNLPASFYNSKGDLRFTAFTVSNRLAWTPVNTTAINLQASLLARYRLYKYSEQYATTQSSGTNQPVAFYGSAQKTTSRSLSLSPSLLMRFSEWLSVQAGFTYDDYRGAPGKNNANKLLPDAGLRLNLAPLAKGSGLTVLELSTNYHQSVRVSEKGDLLETDDNGRQFPGAFGYTVADSAYVPRKVWTTALAVGVWQNRLAVKISYRMLDRTLYAAVPVPYPGGTGYAYLFEGLRSKGWSAEVKADAVKNTAVQWTIRATLYKEEYERRQYGFGVYSQPVDRIFFDAGRAPWRGGFRTNVDVHRFFLQASLLLSFNEAGTADSGNLVDDMTKFNTAFLLAGYRLPLKGKGVKELDLNLQSRNLFGPKHDLAARYAGIGVQASF